MRLHVIVSCLTCSVVMGTSAQQPPRFGATTNLVVVPAVVLDCKGSFVTGLTADKFEVVEDGRSVAIEAFLPPDENAMGADGRFVVLVLDNVRTRTELGGRIQAIAMRFANRMGPTDTLSVITLSRGGASTASTPGEVRAAINRFRPAVGESAHSDGDDIEHGLGMIRSLAQQLAPASHRRKVLVFIGDASMFGPSVPSPFFDREPQLSESWFEAIQSSSIHNVSVYVIDPAGLTGRVDDFSHGFAIDTGGRVWANFGNFDAAVEQIWRESGTYYLLGYRAPVDYRRLHKIDVKVSVPGAVVRARRARG